MVKALLAQRPPAAPLTTPGGMTHASPPDAATRRWRHLVSAGRQAGPAVSAAAVGGAACFMPPAGAEPPRHPAA